MQRKYDLNPKANKIDSVSKPSKEEEEKETLMQFLEFLSSDPDHGQKLKLMNDKQAEKALKKKNIKEEFPSLIDKSDVAKSMKRKHD